MKESKRIEYIDICKGIAIIAVIVGHIISEEYYLHKFIYGFHMPVFLMISGMFFNIEKYKKEGSISLYIYTKKNKILVTSYLFYSVVFILIDFVRIVFFDYPIKKIIASIWLFISMSGINVLWYLTTLFWGMWIFAVLMQKIKNKKNILLISLVFAIGVYFIGIILRNPYFSNDLLGEALYYLILSLVRPFGVVIFVAIGFFLKKYLLNIEYYLPNIRVKLLLLGMTVLYFFAIFYNTKVDIHLLKFGIFPLYIINAILGSMVVVAFSYYIQYIKFLNALLKKFGEYTIFIMCTHAPVIWIDRYYSISERILGSYNETLIFVFVFCLEILLIYLAGEKITILINKKLANLYDKGLDKLYQYFFHF